MDGPVIRRTQGERLAVVETQVTALSGDFAEFRDEYRVDQVEMQRVLGTLVDRTSRLDERTSQRRQTFSAAGIATAVAAVFGFIFDNLWR